MIPVKKMSKEKPLKESIVCEWGSPTICGSHFATVREATLHMREHLLLYRAPNAQATYQCTWKECVWSTQDVAEFHRHCLFHPFHTYLKYLGREYRELKQLPECGLDSSMSNILPSFDKELKCLWSGGNCGKTFDCVSDYYDHMVTHTSSSSMFKCQWSDCSFIGKSKYKLNEHVQTHTQEKTIACPVCGGLFSCRSRFKDHLERQVEINKFTCSYCGKGFITERLLREHVRNHINLIKCPKCDLTVNSQGRLLQHLKWRHSEVRKHVCQVCNKSFKASNDLRKHLEVHSTSQLVCGAVGCRYSTNSLSCLQRHQQAMHSDTGNLYSCHVCNAHYTRGQTLTKHLINQHGYKHPPGHYRFRYITSLDGVKRLQTVRLVDLGTMEQQQEGEGSPQQQDTPATQDTTV